MSELSRYLYGAGGYHTDSQLNNVLIEMNERIDMLSKQCDAWIDCAISRGEAIRRVQDIPPCRLDPDENIPITQAWRDGYNTALKKVQEVLDGGA